MKWLDWAWASHPCCYWFVLVDMFGFIAVLFDHWPGSQILNVPAVKAEKSHDAADPYQFLAVGEQHNVILGPAGNRP
jgi:hypothetical protein